VGFIHLLEQHGEIAHAAVDNTVAMIEVAKADAVIVAGGDGGMNEVLVRQDINKISDLRGRTYVVDAPNTAYALAAKKILKDRGLLEGRDYQIMTHGMAQMVRNVARRRRLRIHLLVINDTCISVEIVRHCNKNKRRNTRLK
jgi:ABC-type nitrate/sulfonate/bicarbonate transport system substrate-binding protein